MGDRGRIDDALRAARETRALELGRGAVARTADVFRGQFGGREAVVVADAQTIDVAGHAVRQSFAAAGLACRDPFVFDDPRLFAEHGYVAQLEASLRGHDA